MDDTETPTEWRELQKRWRAILFDLPPAACVRFIRDTVHQERRRRSSRTRSATSCATASIVPMSRSMRSMSSGRCKAIPTLGRRSRPGASARGLRSAVSLSVIPPSRRSTEAHDHARPQPHSRLQAAAQAHVPGHGHQDGAPPHAHGPPQAPQARAVWGMGKVQGSAMPRSSHPKRHRAMPEPRRRSAPATRPKPVASASRRRRSADGRSGGRSTEDPAYERCARSCIGGHHTSP